MRNLREDYDECENETQRSWVYRARRGSGIGKDEGACWFVSVEQGTDHDTKWFSRSPTDALDWAGGYASGRYAPQRGLGLWTLEVYGDGENPPLMLRVHPVLDEDYYSPEAAGPASPR